MTAPKAPEAKQWYQVSCPRCNADPGDPCAQVNQRGFIVIDSFARKPHAARIRAASTPGAKGGRE